jgi:hypothetical protein
MVANNVAQQSGVANHTVLSELTSTILAIESNPFQDYIYVATEDAVSLVAVDSDCASYSSCQTCAAAG